MKIQLVSDIHMEFAPIEIVNANNADALVLSGDICVATYFNRAEPSPYYAMAQLWIIWFEMTCAQYEHVIYVPGNHEHYKGRFDDTVPTLRRTLGHIQNLHIMDNDVLDINEYRFVGTTLWTDFNRDSMGAKLCVQNALNDYHLIQRVQNGQYRKLRPVDTLFYHQEALRTIEQAIEDHDNVIVVGHHAPSMRSIEEKYQSAGPINYGYASDLDNFIGYKTQIKLWTHGHVHSSHDYVLGYTRIVANPRGYAHFSKTNQPENVRFDPNLTLEV